MNNENMIGMETNPEELIEKIVSLREEYEKEYRDVTTAARERGEMPKKHELADKYMGKMARLMFDVLFFGKNGKIGYDDTLLAFITFGDAMVRATGIMQIFLEHNTGMSREEIAKAFRAALQNAKED